MLTQKSLHNIQGVENNLAVNFFFATFIRFFNRNTNIVYSFNVNCSPCIIVVNITSQMSNFQLITVKLHYLQLDGTV